jgi:protein-disulfide isomerase
VVKKKHVKVAPKKSRTPLYGLLAIVAIVGVAGIWYAMNSATPKPIVLAEGTALPAAEGYLLGDPNAPVTIMEFADFECPGCMQFATMIEPDVRANIIDKGLANFRYFDFPLESHPNSMSASLAAACADEQGKFWEMHDAIYQGFYDWISQKTSNPKRVFQGYLSRLGIDEKQWNQCFDSQKYVGKIIAHRNAGLARQVAVTPTLVIGNSVYPGGLTFDRLKRVVDSLVALSPRAPAASDTAGR